MKRIEVLMEVNRAYNEITDLIRKSSEHGQFNPAYFEQPFKEWFAEKLDELQVEEIEDD